MYVQYTYTQQNNHVGHSQDTSAHNVPIGKKKCTTIKIKMGAIINKESREFYAIETKKKKKK